jgi:hypothetical protein
MFVTKRVGQQAVEPPIRDLEKIRSMKKYLLYQNKAPLKEGYSIMPSNQFQILRFKALVRKNLVF